MAKTRWQDIGGAAGRHAGRVAEEQARNYRPAYPVTAPPTPPPTLNMNNMPRGPGLGIAQATPGSGGNFRPSSLSGVIGSAGAAGLSTQRPRPLAAYPVSYASRGNNLIPAGSSPLVEFPYRQHAPLVPYPYIPPATAPLSPRGGVYPGGWPAYSPPLQNNQMPEVQPDAKGGWVDKAGNPYTGLKQNPNGTYSGLNASGQEVWIDTDGTVVVVGFNPTQIYPASQTHPNPTARFTPAYLPPPTVQSGGGGGGYGGFGSRYGGGGGGGGYDNSGYYNPNYNVNGVVWNI